MSDYLLDSDLGMRSTPQSEPLIGTSQIQNSAGGYVWQADEWTRLHRFLILGSEGGSYYASQKDLTKSNVTSLRKCIANDGVRTVNEIVAISDAGRAPKNDAALYALASCISLGDKATKSAAAEALPKVARIGTHLYHFVAYAETMRGWGRTMKWAVQNWYDQNPEQLALQAVKYRQRDGWSHRDLLRLAHPNVANGELNSLYSWMVGHGPALNRLPQIIDGFEQAQNSNSPAKTAKLVRERGLPREALKTEHLNDPDVWRALLDVGMPMTAMIRNLATMTRLDVLDGEYRNMVVEILGNQDVIHKSRIHPMNVLVALKTYANGRGLRGKNTWNPVHQIIDSLDEAFYLAFDNVESTGKSYLLALDISGSMTSTGYGYYAHHGGSMESMGITPREGSAAMALVTLHAEPNVEIVGFSHELIGLSISKRQRLDDVCRYIDRLPFGATDCSLPMQYATHARKHFDVFSVYTDNETWYGQMHPKQALDQYRQRVNPQAKSVVVGMVANEFTIADPNDAGMMDVVGFDTATPAVISEFSKGL